MRGVTKPFSSVWTRQPRPPRKTGLTREQIVAAAVDLLDAEGLEALSMRKLGARLNAGATSLYWYVANKDELLELALDEVWGLIDTPDPDRVGWREVFTTFAYSMRATIRAHPWSASLLGRLPSVGPSAFALTDRLRRSCVRAGFTGADVYLATSVVMSLILGQVIPEITFRTSRGGEVDTESLLAAMETLAADYPQLRADYRETLPADPEVARALGFEFGLVCVLDGLAARLGEPSSAELGHHRRAREALPEDTPLPRNGTEHRTR